MRWLLAAAVLTSLLLAGCWGRLETNELELLAGYGIDWTAGRYVVTAAVFNTRAVNAPGTTPQNATGPETVFRVGEGADPATAIADVDRVSSRHPLWATASIVVLGEALARRGVGSVLDTVSREPWYKPTTRVLIAHGDAAEVFSTRSSGAEVSVSQELLGLVENAHRDESTAWAPHVYALFRDSREPGRSLLVAAVTTVRTPVPTGQTYEVNDSAVLSNDRLVGWMPAALTRSVLWLTGEFVHGTYRVPCPGGDTSGAIYVYTAKRRVAPLLPGGVLRGIRVRLWAWASLARSCPGTTTAQMQQGASAAIAAETRRAIAWAQARGTDVFGWGADVYSRVPAEWDHTYAAEWPAVFAALPVTLRVDVVLGAVGMVRPA